jgi:hypothetical protein
VTKKSDKSAGIREYLRLLGNPYASLQVVDDVEELEAAEIVGNEKHSYVRHPYAFISQAEEAQETVSHPVARPLAGPIKGELSKVEFRAKCRRIFIPYIPALEKGKLRKHHRDFISRNESRSATMRHRLVTFLERYDILQVPGINAQFNREREVFTEEKLNQIERMADSDD